MLNRLFVSDMQEEISTIQVDLKNVTTGDIKQKPSECWTDKNYSELFNDSHEQPKDSGKLSFSTFSTNSIHSRTESNINEGKFMFDKEMDSMAGKMINDQMIKSELKVEQDVITNYNHMKMGLFKHDASNSARSNVSDLHSIGNNVKDIDIKPTYHSHTLNKENSISSLDIAHFGYDFHEAAAAIGNSDGSGGGGGGCSGITATNKQSKPIETHNDVKKEMDNLDIESEIAPSYIIRKADPEQNRNVVHSPISSTDFDYLCNSNDNDATSSTANSQHKDDAIPCDKEPYDEWLCIQKELNLITDKRTNDLTIDGFIESTFSNDEDDDDNGNACATVKINVERELSDLFNESPNHVGHVAKSDINSHLPLSDLFNDSMVNNSIDANDKDSVEERLEDMFADDGDFDKANDLVESQLEELFHGTSTSPPSATVNSTRSLR